MKKQLIPVHYVLLILISIFGFSCTKDSLDKTVEPTGDTGKFTDLVIPEGFTWNTSKPLSLEIKLIDAEEKPVETNFEIYSSYPDGVKYLDGATDENGLFKSKYQVQSGTKSLVLVIPNESPIEITYIEKTIPELKNMEIYEAKGTYIVQQPSFKAKRNNYYQYYPSEHSFATLSFEDNWPYPADYDFNDVLIDYNVKTTASSYEMIDRIDMILYLRASGAHFHNGVGISFKHSWCWEGWPNPDISQVKVNGEVIPPESGTVYASYILIPDIEEYQPTYNTVEGKAFLDPIRFEVSIEFSSPAVDWWELDLPLNNMFIIVDQDRGREVHLPWYLPTALANPEYVGMGADASDPYAFEPDNFKSSDMIAGYYTYMTEEGYPWGLNIYFNEAGDNLFRYPVEFMDIREAYSPAFDGWVQYWSPWDWYKPEYRVEGKVYETIPDPVYPEMQ